MTKYGVVDEASINEIIDDVNIDKDGNIIYEEFVAMMTRAWNTIKLKNYLKQSELTLSSTNATKIYTSPDIKEIASFMKGELRGELGHLGTHFEFVEGSAILGQACEFDDEEEV
ncbi:hypothetical protein Scep_014754 [Stephania cephalantha]|uniref:EF-hand domain-containing protein n=1 Tax=Stephania cephalantha TaxID=152367 RepID=A0AAP0J1X4_9MAGN